MDAKLLTLLAVIVDAGNLSEAARRLNMTRANVSFQLKQLERIVGQQLLRRSTRSIEPTEVGLRLIEHGRVIQGELAAAMESVQTLGQSLRGRIRLSVPSGYGHVVIAHWLIAFKRLYPGIVIDVMFENLVENLLQENLDIAIRIMASPPENLVAREIGTVRYVACVSREYAEKNGVPTQIDELQTAPVITAGVIGRQLKLAAYLGQDRHEVILEPTIISESFPFLRQAICAGLGVGIVPDYLVRDAIECGDIVTALDEWRLSIFGTHIYMLYIPNRYRTRAVSTFIEFVLEQAANLESAS